MWSATPRTDSRCTSPVPRTGRSDMSESAYAVQRFGEKFRVIDRETGIILRTLDSSVDLHTFMGQLEPKRKEK
jgi:hypothetical protein